MERIALWLMGLYFFCFSGIKLLSGQIEAPYCGHLHTLPIHSDYIEDRNITVWLPPAYSESKRYAVWYAQDGQMLFDSTKTWNRQAWRMDEVMCKLFEQHPGREAIVVAIPNAGSKRHCEYFPEKILDEMTPQQSAFILSAQRPDGSAVFQGDLLADAYLSFIVHELKPLIDKTYSTFTEKESTFLIGSSMGGLISLYGLCEYPEVFGGAACLSTHWPGIFTFSDDNPFPDAILPYLSNCLPALSAHTLYMDHGTATLDQYYPPIQQKIDLVLEKHAPEGLLWYSKVIVGAEHTESAWAERLHLPLSLLMR